MRLEVVSFAVPYPPVYGGVIDVYHRLRALHELGVEIHLHCYTYGDSRPASALNALCASVRYYERVKSFNALRHKMPFIQVTRFSDELLDNLSKGEGPILYEGLHTCGQLGDPRLEHRPAYIRMHNVEWYYYQGLAKSAPPGLWKWYYLLESGKLRKHERSALKHAKSIFAISEREKRYFERLHDRVVYLPPFHPFDAIDVLPGQGEYVLYQGDLSIADNARAAIEIAGICERLMIPFVAAGRAPAPRMLRKFEGFANTRLCLDVSQEEMEKLMREAQIHVIESSIAAGFKLKLLASLFTGRHVVARSKLIDKGLESVVVPYRHLRELPVIIKRLDAKAIGHEDIERRKEVVLPRFSNSANGKRLTKEIFK